MMRVLSSRPAPLWGAALCCALATSACDEPAPAPSAKDPTPAPSAAPAPTKAKPPAQPEGPDPCSDAGPRTLELAAGVTTTTTWGVELTYAIDEDKRGRPGFMFLLRYGGRRWETRRDNGNWTAEMLWRGFCWRGAERPEPRASHLRIEMVPVCKGGKLIQLGGCNGAFGAQ